MQAPKTPSHRPLFSISRTESPLRPEATAWAEWARKSPRQDLSQDLKELQEARRRFQFLVEEVNDILMRG